jgi:hypothetical protein
MARAHVVGRAERCELQDGSDSLWRRTFMTSRRPKQDGGQAHVERAAGATRIGANQNRFSGQRVRSFRRLLDVLGSGGQG